MGTPAGGPDTPERDKAMSRTGAEEKKDGTPAPKARPGAVRKTPRWSAERRPRLSKGDAATTRLVRRLALRPLAYARRKKGKTARPAPQIPGAMTRGCLTDESEIRR